MHHIIFVVDLSGSMVGIFDRAIDEMLGFIRSMREPQTFHIVFFGQHKTVEMPPRKLVTANSANKRMATRFLMDEDTDGGGRKLTFGGATTALPALNSTSPAARINGCVKRYKVASSWKQKT